MKPSYLTRASKTLQDLGLPCIFNHMCLFLVYVLFSCHHASPCIYFIFINIYIYIINIYINLSAKLAHPFRTFACAAPSS